MWHYNLHINNQPGTMTTRRSRCFSGNMVSTTVSLGLTHKVESCSAEHRASASEMHNSTLPLEADLPSALLQDHSLLQGRVRNSCVQHCINLKSRPQICAAASRNFRGLEEFDSGSP